MELAIRRGSSARVLGVDDDEVIEALVSDQSWNTVSLDPPAGRRALR
jgi:hypothetical protein